MAQRGGPTRALGELAAGGPGCEWRLGGAAVHPAARSKAGRVEGRGGSAVERDTSPFAERNIFIEFPLLVFKGIDFTTGHIPFFSQGA